METEPKITHVEPHADFTLTLTFSNGERRAFDLNPYLDLPVFRPLRDIRAFSDLRIDPLGSLVWGTGADLAYDMLYQESESLAVDAE